jgi:hypothetical protein
VSQALRIYKVCTLLSLPFKPDLAKRIQIRCPANKVKPAPPTTPLSGRGSRARSGLIVTCTIKETATSCSPPGDVRRVPRFHEREDQLQHGLLSGRYEKGC